MSVPSSATRTIETVGENGADVKLSRRQRYIVKWNGPGSLTKRARNAAKSQRGYGNDEDRRFVATAYWCRYHGFFPETVEEFSRLAGVH